MDINIEELREVARLFHEIALDAEKILPVIQAAEKNKGVVVPVITERLIERGDVCKILKVGTNAVNTLIKRKQLTPLYVADSTSMKFRLSEVNKLLNPIKSHSGDGSN